MSRGVRFHEDALIELEAQAIYFEVRSKGLGERFTNEIEAAIKIATDFPDMGSPFKYGTRRVFPKKFPFSVVYCIRQSEILVLALVPDARKPGYWRKRLDDA